MFGHENHHQEENKLPEPTGAPVADDSTLGAAAQPTDDGGYIDDMSPAATPAAPAPASDDSSASVADTSTVDSTVVAPAPAAATSTPQDTDKLLDIKQQALQQLTPLVGHLEQSPEEKFRTTMMMIQASDNHELIATAYEAAQQIADEKIRAQALLDIVNEINYFTHSTTADAAAA